MRRSDDVPRLRARPAGEHDRHARRGALVRIHVHIRVVVIQLPIRLRVLLFIAVAVAAARVGGPHRRAPPPLAVPAREQQCAAPLGVLEQPLLAVLPPEPGRCVRCARLRA